MSETHQRPVPLASARACSPPGWRPSSKAREPRGSLPSHSRLVRPIGLRPASAPTPGFPSGPRCSEKGCIFPATEPSTGRCLLHALEEREPTLFVSYQPTMLVLEQAKFGAPDPEADYSRAQDRRRLAAWREQFMEEVA
jgi:hypothetical protein